MHTLHKKAYFLAIGLSALAGCVDAIGFIQLGGYFVSFMSGNTTRLAVNLTEQNIAGMMIVGSMLLCFVLGSMLGVFVRHIVRDSYGAPAVLACVTALLLGAATCHQLGQHQLAVALMALAMGAENGVFQRGGEVVVGLTYMTGALVKMGQRLAMAMLGGAKMSWLPYLLLWLGLLWGGAVGAMLYAQYGLHSLWFAVAFSAVLTVMALLMRNSLHSNAS